MNALLTDLYQLTMLQSYFAEGMEATAVFELFVRKLPPQRNFLVAAGLEPVLQFLETLSFSDEDIDWLRRQGSFSPLLLDRLADLRFEGDVDAMPEGTLFFAEEPFIRVTAPLPQAQRVESRLLNLAHFATLIASKAARIVMVADHKRLIERDVVQLDSEPCRGEALLRPCMRGGRRVGPSPTLLESRAHHAQKMMRLPDALQTLQATSAPVPVDISPEVRALALRVDEAFH